MSDFDVTQTNRVVRELIASTANPRHRYLLMAYDRHRNLEMAGRYDELLAPDMMVADPVYHLAAHGTNLTLNGTEAIRNLYRMWAATNQAAFYVHSEEIAVADGFVASVTTGTQQVSGRALFFDKVLPWLPRFLTQRIVRRVLAAEQFEPDPDAMYLYRNTFQMIWPYDARGRLLGEDVYEPEPGQAVITKLARQDVLTTAEAARQLATLIKPLPPYEEVVGNDPRIFTA